MPRRIQRRYSSALAPSQWERRVYGGLSAVRSALPTVRKVNRVARALAKQASPYLPKGRSTLVRKLGPSGARKRPVRRASGTALANNAATAGSQLVHGRTVYARAVAPRKPFMNSWTRSLYQKMIMQYINTQEADYTITQGSNILYHNNVSGQLPIKFWDLTAIYNDATNPNIGYNLNQAGVFSSAGDVAVKQYTEGHQAIGDNLNEVSRTFHTHSDVRLVLYGRAKESTRFTCMVVTLGDHRNDPGDQTTDGTYLTANFWNPFMAKYTQSPVSAYLDPRGGKARMVGAKAFKILWKKDYFLREQLTTEDSLQKIATHIRIPINQWKNYDQRRVINASSIVGDAANNLGTQSYADHCGPYCGSNQKVFFVICASSYIDTAEDDVSGTLQPSYDISFTNTHFIPRI